MNQSKFEIKINAVGKYYFVFKDFNNKTIGVSQSFSDYKGLEKNILKIKRDIFLAPVMDQYHREKNLNFHIILNNASEYSFLLDTIEGETLIYSEGYEDIGTCSEKLEFFRKCVENSILVDFT